MRLVKPTITELVELSVSLLCSWHVLGIFLPLKATER